MSNLKPFTPLTLIEKRDSSVNVELPWSPILPIPASVLPPPKEHPKHGQPSQQWVYTNATGHALCFVYRFDHPQNSQDTKKWFLPLTFCENQHGQQRWCWQGLNAPRPLYHLTALSQCPEKPVLICEGEKDADAAAQLFPDWVTTTCLNGANAVKKSDWKILVGREIYIWPDHDESGHRFAQTVCQQLLALGQHEIKVLQVPLMMHPQLGQKQATLVKRKQPLIAGWGAADALAEGWTAAHTQLLCESHWQCVGNKSTVTCDKRNKPSQAQQLMVLLADVDVFHDDDKKTYATCKMGKCIEHVAINSAYFQHWLAHRYFKQYQQAPTSQNIQITLNALKGCALFANPCYTVYTRVAQHKDSIYINLANEHGEFIAVNCEGWDIVKDVPIKFRKTSMMRSLPQPESGGTLDPLWSFVNIPDAQDRKLVLVWLLECFRANTPFPILLLQGEQGCAKSTTQQRLRALIDPSCINLRSAPRKIEDIFIGAANNWCVSYNNLSYLSSQEQDAFCTLATGGGYATRQLFTTAEEMVIEIKRPVILNGIGNLVTAQDLIDRCIVLELPPITDQQRKTETELNTAFAKVYPQLLGALLDVLAKTLKILPTVVLAEKPRMADFVALGTAVETALNWPSGSFIQAYQANQAKAMLSGLESSLVSQALLTYLESHESYYGTFATLLETLTPYQPGYAHNWPRSAKGLAEALRRQNSALRSLGVQIHMESQRRKKGYYVNITQISVPSMTLDRHEA
ncbi:MAG: hypothetical protein V3V61_04885 [Gammaproteobacteria bacterium]